jgi:hypothetical protein
MKQRRVERVERRRQLVEINLIADAKTGPTRILGRRGCALFGSAAILAASAVAFLGLH